MQRVKDAQALRASIDVLKTRVAEGFDARLTPELAEGETLPDFGLSIELVGRSVGSALERLRSAEHGVFEREHQVAIVRRRSEQLARNELHPQVVTVRRLIDAEVGKKDGRSIHGMSGKTLRKARRLHAQLEYLVWALEAGRRELPDPLFERVAAEEREAWLRRIKPGYQQLDELLDKLADLEALEQLARDEKNETLRKFDACYGEARRLVEASFGFAGLAGKLSFKLRSYVHRRRLSRDAR
ncbi:MAG: hypothetical protein GY711_12025, partial [bacterium]|nr:hypothetical protein [bacterium]